MVAENTADTIVSHKTQPVIRKIHMADLWDALAKGYDDFLAKPSHVIFLCVLYPIAGLIIGRLALQHALWPLIFPLVAGYALIGPLAALGLYELSRRREQGRDVSWRHAFHVLKSPSIGAIVELSVVLAALFVAWLAVAQAIYGRIFAGVVADGLMAFAAQIFSTPEGWSLIAVGSFVGFLFAIVVLTFGVVSFPMLLDRHVGAVEAVLTSARAVLANPVTMALWGLIVAAILLIASIPLFMGLIVALPVLGHATWHLYRKLVA